MFWKPEPRPDDVKEAVAVWNVDEWNVWRELTDCIEANVAIVLQWIDRRETSGANWSGVLPIVVVNGDG